MSQMSQQEQIQMLLSNERDLLRAGASTSVEYQRAVRDLEQTMENLNVANRIVGRPRRQLARQNYEEELQVGCQFLLTRGARRGQPCGNSRCHQSQTHCSRHHRMAVRDNQVNAQLVQNLPENVEQKEDSLIYDSCPLCSSKVEGAKVTLECGCEYHLNCYLIIQNETHCMKCGDKINKTEEDYEDCSICQEKVKCGGMKTKCGHHFHNDCINSWKNMAKNTCPNCRAEM